MNDSAVSKNWLDKLSNALLREPQDRQQLIILLREAERREILQPDALAMIEGVLQVSEMQARDVMIPRAHVVMVEEQQKLDEFLPVLIESAHSRFPVIDENHEEIIGILHAKDILRFVGLNTQTCNLRDIARPAVHVPESKRLDILLKEFRRNHNHMAVVVDEYGVIAGVVTIEDILEQIVGEIADEFDVDEDVCIKKHSDHKFIIKALTPIHDFNAYFSTNFSEDDSDTIGGLLMQQFGHMPQRGESLVLGPFTFHIISADKRRIHLLQMTR